MNDVWLKVRLSPVQHKKLRMMSAERCVAMSELVRWWIDGNIAVQGASVALVKVPVEAKPVKPMLREGYGWCMGCKAFQVKLPAVLCAKCKGEATMKAGQV